MSPRAVAVSIRPDSSLPFATASGATAAERSLVELLHSAGEYVLAYETLPRRDRRGGVRAAPARVPGRPGAGDAPPELRRGLREGDRDRPALVAAARRLRGGRAAGPRPAGPPRALLVEDPATGLARARAIADEGARFNLGRSFRNFNVPTLVLAFLHPALQPRFSFEWKGKTTIEGRSFVELAFRELRPPSVIRGPDSQPDVLAAGRVCIHDGDDGTVGRTELVLDLPGRRSGPARRSPPSTVPTGARPVGPGRDAGPAPDRARERSARGRSGSVEFVEGLAAYSGFRKASVTTQEEFRVPEPDPRDPTLK